MQWRRHMSNTLEAVRTCLDALVAYCQQDGKSKALRSYVRVFDDIEHWVQRDADVPRFIVSIEWLATAFAVHARYHSENTAVNKLKLMLPRYHESLPYYQCASWAFSWCSSRTALFLTYNGKPNGPDAPPPYKPKLRQQWFHALTAKLTARRRVFICPNGARFTIYVQQKEE